MIAVCVIYEGSHLLCNQRREQREEKIVLQALDTGLNIEISIQLFPVVLAMLSI